MATKRERQRNRKQQKRRYPFNDKTKLIDLVENTNHSRLKKMLERLHPYLLEGEESNIIQLNRLYFDLEKIEGIRKYIVYELASFLKEAHKGLRFKQSVFFRYLSTPEHCNLGIKESSLKALILGVMREIS